MKESDWIIIENVRVLYLYVFYNYVLVKCVIVKILKFLFIDIVKFLVLGN